MMLRQRLAQRYWDHAFASGAAFAEHHKEGGRFSDLFFALLEKWYSGYCSRKVWTSFRENAILANDVRLGNNARLINRNRKDAVKFGSNVVCRGIIRIEKHGELIVGDEVYIGDEVIISAAERIAIGKGALLAHGVQIFDNTSHPLHWEERERHFKMLLGIVPKSNVDIPAGPVSIGEHCWIGTNSIILKGVSIGSRSIIGAGSVVTRDVPPDMLVVGAGQWNMRDLNNNNTAV